MKKTLAVIVLAIMAVFLIITIAKSVNSEELIEKRDPFSLENIQKMGTDPVSMINLLEQDRLKRITFLKNIVGLWLGKILSDEAFVEIFSSTMDNLLVIEFMLEDYQLNYPELFESKKLEVSKVWL